MNTLPNPQTPLYNHALPQIEAWLQQKGCVRDETDIHCWELEYPQWSARICLDIEELQVVYHDRLEGNVIQRSFKYSCPRAEVEEAIFAGP
ncbi:DUF3143 domain-containing protein [Thermosynechococcus sichuanensis E542]|uniref:DUF3143 domain-containing protein n=1 Tax=Thermosynechococcus sichuanensis E542 TaxID=2016101 RepID=A0A3B7MMG9_9CYAN|nr:DUF3143 domain-containing protein [Thermosynechococcus vestitus]AXY68296.1 DUF3143 domain-containing protein [Thermosynechococcus vestitus E542]